MKRCPSCQSTYTDNSLRFCLSDGTPLVADVDDDPQATKLSPAPTKANMPTLALPADQLPDYRAAAETQPRPAPTFDSDSATQQRRIMPILIVGLVLLASAVVVALVITRGRSDDNHGVSRATSDYPTSNISSPQPTPSAVASPTPSATVTPSATPTVTPTPNDSYSARAEVMSALNAWTASLNRQDLDANMRLYADNLDNFYGLSNLSKASVRGKRRANFEMYYSSINVQLSNVSVNLDSSGTVATILYDNTYNWQGGTKSLRGKSHNKMLMSKIGGRWLITSEQHLQTYYEN